LAAVVTLYDLRTWLPPITVLAAFVITGTGAGAASIALGDLKSTDLVNGATGPLVVSAASGTSTEEPAGTLPLVSIEYNVVMADATAGSDLYISGFQF
jgi:hypothetical protein